MEMRLSDVVRVVPERRKWYGIKEREVSRIDSVRGISVLVLMRLRRLWITGRELGLYSDGEVVGGAMVRKHAFDGPGVDLDVVGAVGWSDVESDLVKSMM